MMSFNVQIRTRLLIVWSASSQFFQFE